MKLVQIYSKIYSKITIITNFLAFFSVVIFEFFPPGSGSRRENECGSGSTALVLAYTNYSFIYLLTATSWRTATSMILAQ